MGKMNFYGEARAQDSAIDVFCEVRRVRRPRPFAWGRVPGDRSRSRRTIGNSKPAKLKVALLTPPVPYMAILAWPWRAGGEKRKK